MSAPIGNNAETVKKGSKVLSKGSHKMFFNETEDQLEQSKIMMPQQNFDNTGMKEKN